MGFFSANCKGCGHPALCEGATNRNGINLWMKDVVALAPNGSILIGEYDGYGRVGEYEEAIGFHGTAVWHQACWEVAGKPSYDGESAHADDQGWFFDDPEHDMADPRLS
jgi:hypothetical protein